MEYVISKQRNLEETFRAVTPRLIATCNLQKHAFKACTAWRRMLQIVEILSEVFLIAARCVHVNMYTLRVVLTHTQSLFDTVSASLTEDNFPLDMWLAGAFWGCTLAPLLLHDKSSALLSTRDAVLKLLEPNSKLFLTWVGCLGSIFAEPSILDDLHFLDFHCSLLSTPLLLRPTAGGKCLYSEACLRVLSLTSFSALSVRHFSVSECMLCLHHTLLSCSVSANLRPATERSRLKNIYKPMIDVLER